MAHHRMMAILNPTGGLSFSPTDDLGGADSSDINVTMTTAVGSGTIYVTIIPSGYFMLDLTIGGTLYAEFYEDGAYAQRTFSVADGNSMVIGGNGDVGGFTIQFRDTDSGGDLLFEGIYETY